MTDTDTTQAAFVAAATVAANMPANVKTDAADAVGAAETKVETAVDDVKADVTGDAAGVGKALAADAGDAQSDIEIAHAHATAAIAHIESSGFISDELTKAKNLLAVVVAYIEKHI
jgi:hypothetical protein